MTGPWLNTGHSCVQQGCRLACLDEEWAGGLSLHWGLLGKSTDCWHWLIKVRHYQLLPTWLFLSSSCFSCFIFGMCVCAGMRTSVCVVCTHTHTLAVSVCGWYPCNFAHWHHGFTLLPACNVWECIDTCAHGSKCTWVPRVDSKNYPLSLLYLLHWPRFLIKPRAQNMLSNASLLALEKLSLSSEAIITGGSLYPPSIYMGVEIQTLSLHLCGKHFNPWAIC